ncbi:hypothetical protein [Streptomyces sp. x-80]|uniref:hypothetical protein n=1 Tax=Streptomyces sp. x-80 TaxID=2789282 RepID=UPI00397F0B27
MRALPVSETAAHKPLEQERATRESSVQAPAEGPAMARVSGLPAADIAPLAAPEVADLLHALAVTIDELAALAEPLSDLLHAVVPRTAAPTTRRAVLAWRRAAHAADPAEIPAPVITHVRAELTPEGAAMLDRWLRAAAATTALRDRLRTAAEESRTQGEHTLQELVAAPALGNALALVSPVFSRRMRRLEGKRLGRGERLTAYRYAVRAALKTSPLSSLTELATDRGPRTRVRLHPLITCTLLRAAAPRDGVREHLRWRANSSLRHGATGTSLSVPQQHVSGDGFGWSDDEVIDARERPDLAAPDAASPDLRELPPRRLARYLHSGLMDLEDPCPREDLLGWLTARLESTAAPDTHRAGAELAAAAITLDRIGEGDAARRAQDLATLREHLRTALHRLGSADSWPLDAVTAVYEDRATATAPPLEPRHRATLRQFAGHACDALQVSDAYTSMVAAFVARFGPAGVCQDVFGFCRDLVHTGWPYTTTAPEEPAAPVRPGRSSCRPCVAVLCQASDEGTGHGPVVINRLSSGTGGMVARFHQLLDSPGPAGEFADELRSWLRTIYPQARLVEFVPAWDANPLQEDSCGLLPALHWPIGPRRRGPGTPIEDLRLVHDLGRSALELQQADGTPVAPAYLGIVPQHLISGAARALTVLADPWMAPTHLADATAPSDDATAGEGRCQPRHSVAGAVVRRATWRVDATTMPRRGPGEDLAPFLERTDRWRRACGLPAEVYVRAEADLATLPGDRLRKPIWLALASPLGLEVLAHLAARAGQRPLVFSECLPGRAITGAGRAVEHVLHFARTSPAQRGEA